MMTIIIPKRYIEGATNGLSGKKAPTISANTGTPPNKE